VNWVNWVNWVVQGQSQQPTGKGRPRNGKQHVGVPVPAPISAIGAPSRS
jgi:hypothetical protein